MRPVAMLLGLAVLACGHSAFAQYNHAYQRMGTVPSYTRAPVRTVSTAPAHPAATGQPLSSIAPPGGELPRYYDPPAPSSGMRHTSYYQPPVVELPPGVQPGGCDTPVPVLPPEPGPVVETCHFKPLLPLGKMPETFYPGQGILGQPKLYVPGQPIRNFLRYLTP